MDRAKAERLRALIVKGSSSLSDDDAIEGVELFPVWEVDHVYAKDERVSYGGKLYKVLQAHTSQATWTPPTSPSLYAKVLPGQSGVVGEWVQPGSTNPYMLGDKVTHNGKTWVSTCDNNVWEPGVYGWSEVT